jgi:branched-chain amino acid transport system substrate-binding protein
MLLCALDWALEWLIPRRAVSIYSVTDDVVKTIYIRRVEKVGDRLQNVEFDQVPDFRDPGKP